MFNFGELMGIKYNAIVEMVITESGSGANELLIQRYKIDTKQLMSGWGPQLWHNGEVCCQIRSEYLFSSGVHLPNELHANMQTYGEYAASGALFMRSMFHHIKRFGKSMLSFFGPIKFCRLHFWSLNTWRLYQLEPTH